MVIDNISNATFIGEIIQISKLTQHGLLFLKTVANAFKISSFFSICVVTCPLLNYFGLEVQEVWYLY